MQCCANRKSHFICLFFYSFYNSKGFCYAFTLKKTLFISYKKKWFLFDIINPYLNRCNGFRRRRLLIPIRALDISDIIPNSTSGIQHKQVGRPSTNYTLNKPVSVFSIKKKSIKRIIYRNYHTTCNYDSLLFIAW